MDGDGVLGLSEIDAWSLARSHHAFFARCFDVLEMDMQKSRNEM